MTKREIFGRILFVGIVTVMVGLFVHKTFIQPKLLKEDSRYTVGVTTKRYFAQTRGFRIRYMYTVNGIEYQGSFSSDDEVKYPEGHYLIRFSVQSPWVHEAFNVQVPKEFIEAPADGWSNPPFQIYKD